MLLVGIVSANNTVIKAGTFFYLLKPVQKGVFLGGGGFKANSLLLDIRLGKFVYTELYRTDTIMTCIDTCDYQR